MEVFSTTVVIRSHTSNPKMRYYAVLLLAVLSTSKLAAQVQAVSVVDSITDITEVEGSIGSHELVLFRADGTYQDILSEGNAPEQPTHTWAPSSGTYSFSAIQYMLADGSYQTRATITWTNSNATRSPAFLFFETPTSGNTGGGRFSIYPRISLTGAANVSNNSWISAAHPTMPGFVIEGISPRWVVIRGAGPSLTQFNVSNPIANPSITLSGKVDVGINVGLISTNNGPTVTNTVNSWTIDPNLIPGLQSIFSLAGAFQFTSGSSDCAGLVLLEPGAYVVEGATSSSGGQLLTEVYVLPYGS